MRSLFLGIFVFASAAFAGDGGWIGSGGELFKDAHNPWFVRNTPEISYCIQVAPTSISVSQEKVRQAVHAALSYWKDELTRASDQDPAGNFKLGMQTLKEIGCTETTDIRFLFGYETLSKEEIEFLKEPKKYIGITVRTSYDRAQLRGKGFVYISSDFGPNAYENSGQLIERAWERPQLLQYALLHEIGHVFGLVHTGAGLMSEAFLEQMLNTNLTLLFQKLPIPSFFSPPADLSICDLGITMVTRNWVGMKSEHNCVVFKKRDEMRIEVFGKGESTTEERLGLLQMVPLDSKDFQPRPAIFLHLTDEQKVFSTQETLFRSFMFGPMFKEYGMKANFVSGPGQVKPAYLRVTPSSLLLTSMHNNKVELVINYNSPLGLFLMIKPTP